MLATHPGLVPLAMLGKFKAFLGRLLVQLPSKGLQAAVATELSSNGQSGGLSFHLAST